MFATRRHRAVPLVALVLAAACGGGGDGSGGTVSPPPPAAVATVTVTPAAATLLPAATQQLSAATLDASGNALSGRTITWSVDAATVASVSANGLVTAVAGGTATVTATSEGKTGAATITVLPSVATVTLDKAAITMVPGETSPVTAVTRAANGDTLKGRTIAWSSSAATVASVSASGLVTALSSGTATISASVEGKSATVAITVNQGGVVTSTGTSTIATADSSVRIEVPQGAAPPGLAISIQPTTDVPSPLPNTTWKMGTTLYKFGPDGTTFSQPVKVTLKYDPATLPAWVAPSDLRLYRWNGSAWSALGNVTVDSVKKTVSATTPGFSTFTLTANLPPATLTPLPAQVNYNQRSVDFTASVPGHVANAFSYRWVTTGSNGVLGVNFGGNGAAANNGPQQQYIATPPILPEGNLDIVGVEVSAQQVVGGPYVPIATAQTTVDAKLGRTYELNPWSQLADFGQTRTMQAVVRERDGSIYSGSDVVYEYSATQYAGNTTPTANAGRVATNTANYTAFPIQQQLKKAPRVDQITVTFWQKEYVWSGNAFGFTQRTVNFTKLGTADGFVEVGKDTFIGRFAVETTITNNQGGGCVYAYMYAPKVTPAPKKYDLKAYGFNDPGGYGTSIARSFAGATGSGFTDVQDAGTEWRIGLDGGCTPTSVGVTFRQGLYPQRFAGIQVEVKVTP